MNIILFWSSFGFSRSSVVLARDLGSWAVCMRVNEFWHFKACFMFNLPCSRKTSHRSCKRQTQCFMQRNEKLPSIAKCRSPVLADATASKHWFPGKRVQDFVTNRNVKNK